MSLCVVKIVTSVHGERTWVVKKTIKVFEQRTKNPMKYRFHHKYSNLAPVILWEGKEYTAGNTITLNQPLSNFTYIDIYVYLSGNSPIYTYKSNATYFEFKSFNTANNLSSLGIGFAEGRLDRTSDQILTLNSTSWILWQWNGSSNSNATKGIAPSSFYVYRIEGRK